MPSCLHQLPEAHGHFPEAPCHGAAADQKGQEKPDSKTSAKSNVQSAALAIAQRLGIISGHQQAQLQAASSLTRMAQHGSSATSSCLETGADSTALVSLLRYASGLSGPLTGH